MKYIFYIFVSVLLLCESALAVPLSRQQLTKGETASLETDYDIGDVAVSNTTICDFMITESRREIYLNPRMEGVATLTVWDATGKKRDVVPVEVYGSNVKGVAEEAKSLFSNSNVDVQVQGRRVVLAGEATSQVELEQASSLASRYKEIDNRVSMSGEVLATVASKVEAAIAIPGVKVRNVRGKLILEGIVFSSDAAKKAYEIAKLYEPAIINLLDVKETGRRPGYETLVELNFYFMEVKKEALRSLGVRWSPGSFPKNGDNGGGLMGGVANLGSTLIGFVFNLLPKLKFLREKGEARILDEAKFVVKSGEAADFFNGTQVPYYSGDNVTFKDVGMKIHAEPISQGSAVDLVLATTLSSPSASIDAGIDTRSFSTSAFLQADQSVILANVISNREVKTTNRKPSDADTSTALFNLAASKDFQSGRTEFVVFVVPRVVQNISPAEEKLKEYLQTEEDMISKRSRREYEEFMDKKGRVPKVEKNSKKRRRGW